MRHYGGHQIISGKDEDLVFSPLVEVQIENQDAFEEPNSCFAVIFYMSMLICVALGTFSSFAHGAFIIGTAITAITLR